MENKITMPRLAAMLAIATGKQKKLCEDFLKEISRIVSDELENGGNVRIKGFGTFKLVDVESRKSVNVATGEEHEIPGHKKVIFVAAKELAATVNAPFEAFEAVEVADDIPTDVMLELPDDETPEQDTDSVSETLVQESEDEELCDEATSEAYGSDVEPTMFANVQPSEPLKDELASDNNKDSDLSDQEDSDLSDHENSDLSDQEDSDEVFADEKQRGHRFGWGFLSGFIAASLVAVLFLVFFSDLFVGKDVASLEDNGVILTDSVDVMESQAINVNDMDSLFDSSAVSEDVVSDNDDVPTRPSDEVIYDTISTTRFLTTMAKDHYGNFNLWPVIYEENKAILGHPDRIRPGTKVVVPTLDKYGVDPNNPKDVARIKQKGVEIYSRYK